MVRRADGHGLRARPLSERLLELACGTRCGIVPLPQRVEGTRADLPDVLNAAISDGSDVGESTSGGVGRTPEAALAATIGEALERYCASTVKLPLVRGRELARDVLDHGRFALFSDAQYATKSFHFARPQRDEAVYSNVFSAHDNRQFCAPEELVSLGARSGHATVPSTSSGLAADRSPTRALLRALEELLERDALASTWLNALPGREVPLDARYTEGVHARGGVVRAFDLTQRWNPHPVVVVCGHLPLRGLPRIALGAACRATFSVALEKAWLEWIQGTIFAGYYLNEHPGLRLDRPEDVTDFLLHGVYFALHPERWPEVPLVRHASKATPPPDAPAREGDAAMLEALLSALAAEGIEVYYRDLTTPDVRRLGLHVVRALSPQLSLLHGDHNIPFLGGRTMDYGWRYPSLMPVGSRPSSHPHPLG